MTNEENIIINGYKLIFGEEYDSIIDSFRGQIIASSNLDREGNAFITVGEIDIFEIRGEATLFFHKGVLDNIVLSPEWNMYNFVNKNGERMHIDEAMYSVYKKCHDSLVDKYGPKVNEEFIPEIYEISEHNFAALYISPGRDSVSLTLRSKP